MVDRNRILAVLPHYIAMIASIFLMLLLVRWAVGDPGFWVELFIVLVVAFSYPAVVRYLDVAPPSWETDDGR